MKGTSLQREVPAEKDLIAVCGLKGNGSHRPITVSGPTRSCGPVGVGVALLEEVHH